MTRYQTSPKGGVGSSGRILLASSQGVVCCSTYLLLELWNWELQQLHHGLCWDISSWIIREVTHLLNFHFFRFTQVWSPIQSALYVSVHITVESTRISIHKIRITHSASRRGLFWLQRFKVRLERSLAGRCCTTHTLLLWTFLKTFTMWAQHRVSLGDQYCQL